MRLIWRVRRYS